MTTRSSNARSDTLRIAILLLSLGILLVKGPSRLFPQADEGAAPADRSATAEWRFASREGERPAPRPSIARMRNEMAASAQVSVKDAFRKALEIDNPYEKECALDAVIRTVQDMDAADCEKALREAEWGEPADPREANLKVALIKGWALSDPDEALQWIAEHKLADNFLIGVMPEVMTALWRKDPGEARAFLDKQPPGNLYNAAYLGLTEVMAHTDPAKALELAAAFPDEADIRNQCLAAVAKTWAENNADSALTEFLTMEGPFKPMLGVALAAAFADRNPGKAVEFAQQLEGGARTEALLAAAAMWADSDPKGMADYLDRTSELEERGAMMNNLAKHWSRYSPEEAVEWFDRLAAKTSLSAEVSGPGAPSVVDSALAGSSLAMNIFELDPARGRQWLNELEDGPVRDGILTNVLGNDMEPDRETAFSLALTFTSAKLRVAQAKRQLTAIAQSDPSLARRLADSADVPLEERGELLKAAVP